MATIDPEIQSFYDRRPEEGRLLSGPSQMEAVRTRSFIERFAPAAPATVLDLGGAAGAYAFWLADLGYSVHLLDPVPRLVAEAERRNAAAAQPLQSCRAGDARMLPYPTSSADIVLLLGPLYHLTESADRRTALDEAFRVLKPGGVLFAAAISRWASAMDGIARDNFVQPGHWPLVKQTVVTGENRNPDQRIGGFTTAYFHRPDELASEIAGSGFDVTGVFPLEGFAGFFPDFDQRWADPRQRENMLRVAELLEYEPSLLGATPHLLAIGGKAAPAHG